MPKDQEKEFARRSRIRFLIQIELLEHRSHFMKHVLPRWGRSSSLYSDIKKKINFLVFSNREPKRQRTLAESVFGAKKKNPKNNSSPDLGFFSLQLIE